MPQPPAPLSSRREVTVDPAAVLLIISTILFSWLAMMVVHEFGHVLHAWLSGGRVTKVVLYPLSISRTDVEPNPNPLFVAWGGPVWGCVLPGIVLFVARFARLMAWPIFAFFVGFCLIANGAYLGIGYWHPVGDALELLRHGTPDWALAAFGVATVPAGLWLWHGLGPYFGIGRDRKPIQWRTALFMTALVASIVVLETTLSDRM